MTPRERFLAAVHQKPVDRPPIWLMRRGRPLPTRIPSTQAAKHDFLDHGADTGTRDRSHPAAAQALPPRRRDHLLRHPRHPRGARTGLPLPRQGGIGMDYLLDSEAKSTRSTPRWLPRNLATSAKHSPAHAIKLGDDTALLGFCGSPMDTRLLHGRRRLSQRYTKSRSSNSPSGSQNSSKRSCKS